MKRRLKDQLVDVNQVSQRNLTEADYQLIVGRIYNRTKKQGSRTDLTSDQNDQKSTAEALAQEHDVSTVSVRRYGKLAEIVFRRLYFSGFWA